MNDQFAQPYLRRADELVHVLAVTLLDFRFADLHPLLDVLAADFLDEDTLEELLLQLFDGRSLKLHLTDELRLVREVHLLDGRFLPFVEVPVRDPEAALVGNLEDQRVVHHSLEDRSPKRGLDLGIVGYAETFRLDDDLPLQLAERDHVPVDEGDDAIHHFGAAGRCVLRGRGDTGQAQDCGEPNAEKEARHDRASHSSAVRQ